MFLSMLELNPRSRQVQAELRDPYQMHRTLSRAFGDDPATYEQARCLFRVDEESNNLRVLVQSRVRPDWSLLTAERYLLSDAEMKEFDPVLEAGRLLRFRLRANPTVKIKTDKRNGRRVGIYEEEKQCKWLKKKGEKGGFEVMEYSVSSNGFSVSSKSGETDKIKHLAVLFDGVLRVTDEGAFREALESGIGSAKGFGFGLLSIAPAR